MKPSCFRIVIIVALAAANLSEFVFAEPTSVTQNHFPYSFTHAPYIHPKIVQDLTTWLSDKRDQVIAIGLLDSLNNQSEKNQFNPKLQQAPRVAQPKQPLVPRPQLHPRHPTPTARQGEASDVLDALMKIPAISRGIENVKRSVAEKVKRDWKHLSTGGKVALISQTVVMGGGFVASALGSKAGRKELYELLRNKEITMPVPGVSGLKLQLKAGNEHKALIMFDIAEFLRSR